MNDINYIHNKIILVTGGSKGIGNAICNYLSEKGAIVIDASIDSIDCLYEDIKSGNIYQKRTDVSNQKSVESLFSWIDDTFKNIDILINNAGVFVFKPVAQITFEEWRNMMRVNLDGAFLCIREALQRMLLKQKGQIINVGSIAGQVPLPNNGAYGTSKAAIKILTQIINEEYFDQGIKATVLILGTTSTELWNNYPTIDKSKMIAPAKIASTVGYIIEQNSVDRIEEVCLLPSFRFIDNL